jgi:hypothetical protein
MVEAEFIEDADLLMSGEQSRQRRRAGASAARDQQGGLPRLVGGIDRSSRVRIRKHTHPARISAMARNCRMSKKELRDPNRKSTSALFPNAPIGDRVAAFEATVRRWS